MLSEKSRLLDNSSTATVVSLEDSLVGVEEDGASASAWQAEVVEAPPAFMEGMGVGEGEVLPTASTAWSPEFPSYRRQGRSFTLGLILSVAAATCLIVLLVDISHGGDITSRAPFISFIVLYSLMLVESIFVPLCTQGTLLFLCNMEHSDFSRDEHARFDLIRKSRPRFKVFIECFHYETRVHHVTETYRENGETKTRHRVETRTEKVVTHKASQEMVYQSWIDLSGPGPRLQDMDPDCVGLLVTVLKDIELADEETKLSFASQKRDFVNAHRYYDEHHSVSERVEVDNFSNQLFLHAPGLTPWYLKWYFYVLAALLFMSWPFRRSVQNITMATSWTLRSQVSVRPNAFPTVIEA